MLETNNNLNQTEYSNNSNLAISSNNSSTDTESNMKIVKDESSFDSENFKMDIDLDKIDIEDIEIDNDDEIDIENEGKSEDDESDYEDNEYVLINPYKNDKNKNKPKVNSEDKNPESVNPEDKKLFEEWKELALYDPKVDVLSKIIFGDERNNDLAISLLNSILPKEHQIETFERKSEELISIPYDKSKKKVIVDLYLYSNKGKHFILEMKIFKKQDIVLRADFTFFTIESNRIKAGGKFILKDIIYSINFLYYNIIDDDDYIHYLNYNVKFKKNTNVRSNHKVIIELRKFRDNLKEDYLKKLSEEIENDKINKQNNEIEELEKKLKRDLWFAFLSKINVVYKRKSNKKKKDNANSKNNTNNNDNTNSDNNANSNNDTNKNDNANSNDNTNDSNNSNTLISQSKTKKPKKKYIYI